MANLAYIQITRQCNQKCLICSNPPSGWKDLPLFKVKKIINGYIGKNYEGLILSGGEPTVYPHLPEVLTYCRQKKFPVRIISNGQKLADPSYVKELKKAGLKHAGISIYSHRPEIQAGLTGNPNALSNIKKALKNLVRAEIRIDICMAISKMNADHLSEAVDFILKKFPSIKHFIFNNLDPTTSRVRQNRHTIPTLGDMELELIRALKLLEKKEKTFRVERVPLCYLPGFEHCSTETRKIAKGELRPIYFLDKKGFLLQEGFFHKKCQKCRACSLKSICAGLFQINRAFSSKELYPVFVSEAEIREKILVE